MTRLLLLLLPPFLCQGSPWFEVPIQPNPTQGATLPPPPRCRELEAGCADLQATLHLLQVASNSYLPCPAAPACDCAKDEAEEQCVAYVASVVHRCSTSDSPASHQGECVAKELMSGFPTGLAPCSSTAEACSAIASFSRRVAKTARLICPTSGEQVLPRSERSLHEPAEEPATEPPELEAANPPELEPCQCCYSVEVSARGFLGIPDGVYSTIPELHYGAPVYRSAEPGYDGQTWCLFHATHDLPEGDRWKLHHCGLVADRAAGAEWSLESTEPAGCLDYVDGGWTYRGRGGAAEAVEIAVTCAQGTEEAGAGH